MQFNIYKMATRNLHAHPFDEETILKLEIFEDYIKEWLPTFVMSHADDDIWIFDFFAGTGRDLNGVAGSPIRILQQINGQAGNIFQKKCKVHICLNEYDSSKFNSLKQCCEQYIGEEKELNRLYNRYFFLQFHNEDFAELFPRYHSIIHASPSLIFLDQNGMKFLADKYLSDLEKLPQTDFLYYLSSSYFIRFGETNAFQTNMKIDMDKVRQNPYKYVHRSILEQLKERLPQGSKLKLYPFTIKKGANIYGIIFGAKHPLAVDKFLRTVWKKNTINGEANFDIDDDKKKGQLDIWGERRLTKIESFQEDLKQKVLSGELSTNREVYDFTLEQGHIPLHASDKLKEMKKEKLIEYDAQTPLVNYDQVYKKKRIVSYKLTKQ